MKKLFVASTLAAGLVLAAPGANAATTIDVDGTVNASLNGSNAVNVVLGAGTYNLTFTEGLFEAFSRFSGTSGCDGDGKNCVQGFENSIKYTINGQTFSLGDGGANGGAGPQSPGDGYFSSTTISLQNAAQYLGSFTLSSPTTVGFFLFDDNLSDNRGGVSLSISAVPEPATWMMMLLGFGAVGFVIRRRRGEKQGQTKIRFAM